MERALIAPYTPEYQEKCFVAWYSAGRPTKSFQIRKVIPPDDNNRTPSSVLITKWRNELGWDFRADELDAKAAEQSDNLLVQQKVTMLREQAERGTKLQVLGMESLETRGFDSASAAVQAVIRGAELERSSRGISEMFMKMTKMNDVELSNTIANLMTRASSNEQIIDAESVTTEDKEEETAEEE